MSGYFRDRILFL